MGLDIVVFGNNINEFRRRFSFSNVSILKQYYDALEIFKNEYMIERIEGGFRKPYELVPFEAFREAIANALIHRTWDLKAYIKVEMHPDKIIISSPGGLTPLMSEEDFLQGSYSYLRNPIISEVFHRLNIVEKFATGIKRIHQSYENSLVKPLFSITSGSISVSLPVFKAISLTEKEEKLYCSMKPNYKYSRQELEEISGIEKDTIIRTLNSLIKMGLIHKEGNAKATRYLKK